VSRATEPDDRSVDIEVFEPRDGLSSVKVHHTV
jgi:hypothetical protein